MTIVYSQTLPISNIPQFEYNVTIDGVSVNLNFYYNYRTKYYHLTATLLNGTILFDGFKITPLNPFPITTNMFNNGFRGTFNLYSIQESVIETEDTIKNWASYYFLSYVVFAAE